MTTCFLAPDPIQSTQLIPGGNTPANGGKLFFYVAGSSTKQTVYKDNAGNTAWSNPIVLDSGGNLPLGGSVWFPTGQTFKVVFAPSTDTDPPVSPYWTKDTLAGMNDTSSGQSEWISGPTPTFVNATQFTLAGDQTAIFSVGRRVRTTNTGGTVYSTITRSVFGATTTVTLQNDSGALDSGLSAVSYGIISASNPSTPAATINAQPLFQARLSLQSGVPVTSTDVASSTAFFLTPFKGNVIDIYDGSANWNRFTMAEVSSAVPNTSNTVYDVTIYNSTGVLALSSTAWTNVTTRAVNLALQNGVYVLNGALGHRYAGTIRTSNTAGQVDDTVAHRYVWNYSNRVLRKLRVVDSASSWTYTSNAWRSANNNAANRVGFVVGRSEDFVQARANTMATNSLSNFYIVGIGFDRINGQDAQSFWPRIASATGTVPFGAIWDGLPADGSHFLNWLENGAGSTGTTTVFGTDTNAVGTSSLTAEIWA